jgi:hypothetical protein
MRSTAPVSSLGPKAQIAQHVIQKGGKEQKKKIKGAMLNPNSRKGQQTYQKGKKQLKTELDHMTSIKCSHKIRKIYALGFICFAVQYFPEYIFCIILCLRQLKLIVKGKVFHNQQKL